MRLSAVMIVKNEAEILAKTLSSLAGFDDIVVVDTGSSDDTVAVCRKLGITPQYFPWRDDFAAARNFAMSFAVGDWAMSIDADHTLMTPTTLVRMQAQQAEDAGHRVASILLRHVSGQSHTAAWLFKLGTGVRWVGRIHEHLSEVATFHTSIEQTYSKSPSHAHDPERNLRILLASDQQDRRIIFYLGREYFERQMYSDALVQMDNYLKVGTWLPEICEALLTKARCHWALGAGDLARQTALEAVRNNPMFKEALLFLAELHYEPWKSRWAKLATVADNSDVLFVRVT